MIETLPPEVLAELEGLLEKATDATLIQGYLLRTQWTDRLPKSDKAGADAYEALRVYVNFTPEDEGRSRKLIALFERAEDAAVYTTAINNLPSLISAARSTEAMRADLAATKARETLALELAWTADDKLEAMRAENERLTAALEQVLALRPGCAKRGDELKAAREALERIKTLPPMSGLAIARDISHAALLSTITPTGDEDV